MAISHRLVISFGLVAMPIAMYTSAQDNDIHFNHLHKDDQRRIKYKRTYIRCGKEITRSTI